MSVSDDDERFWSMVWPKLDAGSWRYELQARRVTCTAPTAGAGVCAVESSMDDDVGESSSHVDTRARVDGDAKANLRSESEHHCEEDCGEPQNEDKPRDMNTVPVFFPPPRGATTGALEEALRRNLPADGSAGAKRPDRFEGVEAMMELLTQVPGFPAAMTCGTAPNMEAIAAAAEAISFRPSTPPKATARRNARTTERLAARYSASEKPPDEQPSVKPEAPPPVNQSTRLGRVIRKPVKLEVNAGRQTLMVRTATWEAASVGSGAAVTTERCVARLGTEVNAGSISRPWVACSPPAAGDLPSSSKPAGNRTGEKNVGDCAGGEGGRAGGKSGGGVSATDGRSDDTNSGASSVGAGKDTPWERCSLGSLTAKVGPDAGGSSGGVGAAASVPGLGGSGGNGGILTPVDKAKNADWIVPNPPPPRPVGWLGEDPTETVKEFKRAFEDVIWPALVSEFEWTRMVGPRPTDSYFLPKGVVRGQNGAKCRENYFDSFRQVIVHLVGNEPKFGHILKRAWATAVSKPRPPYRPVPSKQKKKKASSSKSRSAMMEKEYPKKVSRVGLAHQVDPANICPQVPVEQYVPPDDVEFEQVWAPMPLEPDGSESEVPDKLVREFLGVVSHDKCLEILFRCGGDIGRARAFLDSLLRIWRARYPAAGLASKATGAARGLVERKALLVAAAEGCRQPQAFESFPVVTSASVKGIACELSATGPATAVVDGSAAGELAWQREFLRLHGGEAALKRQMEGGVSCRPPGARSRDKLTWDLNLSPPWSPREAETFSRVLLEENGRNFYAVQKALPDRQICELVDRYYGGWKQTEGYKTLKGTISLAKLQSICWVCQTGGDLLCCEGCDAVYHTTCAGLSVVPEGDWFCPMCVKNKKNAPVKETQEAGAPGFPSVDPVAVSNAPACAPTVSNSSSKKKKARHAPGENASAGRSQNTNSAGGGTGSGGGSSSSSGSRCNGSTGMGAVIERVPILFRASHSQMGQTEQRQVVSSTAPTASRPSISKSTKRPKTSGPKKGQETTNPTSRVPSDSEEPPRLDAAKSSLVSHTLREKVLGKKRSRSPKVTAANATNVGGRADGWAGGGAAARVNDVGGAPADVHGDERALTEVEDSGRGRCDTSRDAAEPANMDPPIKDDKPQTDWWLCLNCSIFNHAKICRVCQGPKPPVRRNEDLDNDDEEDIVVDVVAVGMGPGAPVSGGMFGGGTVSTAGIALALNQA